MEEISLPLDRVTVFSQSHEQIKISVKGLSKSQDIAYV